MPKGRIEIDIDKCKGCEICIGTCRFNVITLSETGKVNAFGFSYLVAVKPDLCNGCALCGQMCPDSAIEVFREEKKKAQAGA